MNNLSIAQVMSALQAGRLEQAAVLGDTLLQQLQAQQVSANDLADAYHLRGMVQRERGLLAEARADMRQASTLDGDNAMLWLHIAQVEQRMQLVD